jgi:hypothetical protein
MNDQELDDVLNGWHAPTPSPSLRERIRAGFSPHRGRWFTLRPRTLAVAAAFAALALLFIVPRAAPQPVPAIPWTIEFQFLEYNSDGSSRIEMGATSYMLNGNETIVSRWAPSNPMKTAMWQAIDAIGHAHERMISSLFFDQAKLDSIRKVRQERAARSIGAITGCGPACIAVDHFGFERATPGANTECITGTMVGRATILGHPTVAFRMRWTEHGRDTFWMAPDLACVTLRSVYEAEQPDGSFKVVGEKRAVKINM